MTSTQTADEAGEQYAMRCGSIDIDRRSRRLRQHGQPLAMGSRAFDLLLALIDGRHALQSSAALKAAVWPDRVVGDNNLRVQLTHLRRLLGEQAIVHRLGHGYQLLLPVHEDDAGTEPMALPGNLPEALWPLVGRDDWLMRLQSQLQPGCRVTLLGPGGSGKTSLALAAAAQCAPRFADGAWWVDLSPLRDGSQVAGAVAQALGFEPAREHAVDALASDVSATPQRLLLLDNAEHLRAGVTELCDRLLRAAPQVAVLVTSRVTVGQAGAQALPLPPLSLPALPDDKSLAAARASGAVCLLESRARCIDPRFRLNVDNAAVLLDICRRLEGHALALTLAAARLPLLGLQALSSGLDERLRWRQQAAPGSAAPQHLSLQGTLEWSCSLLSDTQRELLRRLGVFRGHFSLAAAQAVALAGMPAIAPAGAAQALEDLVGQSLVSMDGADLLQAGGHAARYSLHASTRLYARELLHAAGEDDTIRAALARHLCATLAPIQDHEGVAEREQVNGLLPDVQDLVEWATAVDPALAAQLCHLAVPAWRRSGQHALVRSLAEPLLGEAADARQASQQMSLLLRLCLIDYELDNYTSVMARCDHVLRLMGDEPDRLLRARALSWQANVQAIQGQVESAEPLYRRALHDYRAAGDERGLRESLNNLGWSLQALHRPDEARPVLHDALDRSRTASDDWAMMVAHENLGELELGIGEPAAALPHLEALAVLARRHPDLHRLASARMYTALACASIGESGRAFDAVRDALRVSRQQGSLRLQSGACSALALTLLRAGQPARAHSVLVVARRLRAQAVLPCAVQFAAGEAQVERDCAAMLQAAERQAAQVQGELMSLDEVEAWAGATPTSR